MLAQEGGKALARPQRREDAHGPAAPDAGPSGVGLGITTKFTDTFAPGSFVSGVVVAVDPETGEISAFGPNSKTREMQPLYDRDEAQLDRWILQRTARRILSRPDYWEPRWKRFNWQNYLLESGAMPGEIGDQPVYRRSEDCSTHQVNAPLFRVVQCHQTKLSGKKKAELWQSPKSGYVKFHNLGVCGSVWTCPICSPRIGGVRRQQISSAYEAILSSGGVAYMVTFTIRHALSDDCADLVERLKEAFQILQKSRPWKNITRKAPAARPKADSPPFMHWLGKCAALEVTHGRNGWHPHEHHLFFFKQKLTDFQVQYLRSELATAWQSACVKAGLPPPSLEHGLDVRIALSASDYLTKFGTERGWSIERELVQADRKRGRFDSRTPFQLLHDAASGDKAAANHFSVFAEAFRGRSQLQFSRTLLAWLRENAQLDIDTSEAADIEISEALDEESKLLGELNDSDFEIIVRNSLHGIVLLYCRKNGFDATVSFIRSFKNTTQQRQQ